MLIFVYLYIVLIALVCHFKIYRSAAKMCFAQLECISEDLKWF